MTVKKGGRVLSFDRDGEFYYSKYEKLADRGNMIDALVALRAAAEKQPDEVEFSLELAELYTEMCFFEESIFLLFELMRRRQDCFGDGMFGLGCNFYGLHDLAKARECFEQYLRELPGGKYAGDCHEFLSMIEEDELMDADQPA
ncbi:MAG: hypothetical protein IJP03_04345, partial [Christensenellaceae bacterium]|nr:hypothetical protein [Christensenellaceae bacterium]